MIFQKVPVQAAPSPLEDKVSLPSLSSRTGATLVFVALTLVALLGVASLAIDIGHLLYVRTRLQATADAVALAAAQEIPNPTSTRTIARQYATSNEGGDTSVLADDDVQLGLWDTGARSFAPGQNPPNAVHVIVRRSAANNNPVGTWFARVLGIDEAGVEAEAIATKGGGGGSRFLIDDEMIDSDEPVIEELADRYGMGSEEIISDNDGDWFIDLPPGEILELPTGQVGDEGLFDFNQPGFPFTLTSDPSLENFLNYNEDSNSWRYDEVPKRMLDPLVGVDRVDEGSIYPSFVSPNCQVSPVYKSDISALNPVDGYPAVNALGWRRGLLAFKILGVGRDPDGSGSRLPNLIIEICPPVPDLSQVEPGAGSGGIRLVL
jgi:hypothetical protein